MADGLDGVLSGDNEFYDVLIGGNNYLEVKTMLKGGKPNISVHADALIRKIDGISAAGANAVMHTALVDDRDQFAGGAYADRFS